jgi:hypothetical protein
MKGVIDWIAMILLVVGGLNWGLVGIWNFDVVTWIFGSVPTVATIVYILVGVAGLWGIYHLVQND